MDRSRKDKFLASLGVITVNFQCLEKYMEFFIWALIGDDQEIGQIVTSQISFNGLCDLLSSLFRYRAENSELVKELDDLIKRANEVVGERNKFIHSSWFGDFESSIVRVKITARGKTGLKHQYENIGPDDLLSLGRSIKLVWEALMEFIKKSEDAGIISPTSYQVLLGSNPGQGT
jgi:hypothetical protein